MRRIIVVYNPRSSKNGRVREEVIEPLQKMQGVTLGKFEVKPTNVDENAGRLAKILRDDDLVISAGGDGTATIALNGAMLSEKKVIFSALPYGNFNDMAGMFKVKTVNEIVDGVKKGATKMVYPLEAVVDGEHFRYAMCYFTMGMFAESTEVFDAEETRGKLKKGKKGMMFSLTTLAKWYFKNRKKVFIPEDVQIGDVSVNGMRTGKDGRRNKARKKQATDILVINGRTAAKLMKGGEFWKDETEFLVSVGRLAGFFRLVAFMMRAVIVRVPGRLVRKADAGVDEKEGSLKIDFSGPVEVEVQAEGEYKRLSLTKFVVRKGRGIRVVTS